MQIAPRFVVVATLGLALVVAACSGNDGTDTTDEGATLRILAGTVEVSAAGAGFTPGADGQALTAGDAVRTLTGGRAAIEWFDGSVTRLDSDTTFTLGVVESLPGGDPVIEGEQDSGATYNRVASLTEAGSRFDVVTPTATASVQGTTFAVRLSADGSMTVAVFDGTVLAGGVPVPGGFMVVIAPDGTVGELQPIPDDFLESDWILYNQCDLDAAVECVPVPASIELTPAAATIAAGGSQEYSVEAFDAAGESLGDVTAESAISGPGCSGTTCSPTGTGAHTITATYEGLTDTASLTVTGGSAATLQVNPGGATAPAGQPQHYTAVATDAHGNNLGSVDAVFSIAGGACDGASCSSNVAGDHLVTATFAGATGTATLTVTPGRLSYIVISPSAATVDTGEMQSYTARGYDGYGNLRGNVSASYSIVDGFCEGNQCTSTVPGDHIVTGTHAGKTDTAVLTVVIGPAAAIELEYVGEVNLPDSFASGDAFGFFGGLVIGCEQHVFRATVTDGYGNPITTFNGTILFGDSDGGEDDNIGFDMGNEGLDFGVVAVTAEAGEAEVIVVGYVDGSVTLLAAVTESNLVSNGFSFAVSGGCSTA